MKKRLNHIEIVELYNQGVSSGGLAKMFGTSRSVVCRILQNFKVEIRGNRKYSVNESYFDVIDAEDKAYWLGFLFADGFVRRNELAFGLAPRDKAHVELFCSYLKSNHPIKYEEHTVESRGKQYLCKRYRVYIFSKRLHDMVVKHGCVENKTYRLSFPDLSTKLIRPFVLGYFDGDGSISINKNGNPCLNFVSSSLSFLRQIADRLVTECNVRNPELTGGSDNFKYIAWGSKADIKNIYEYFYESATIFLARKKIIFESPKLKYYYQHVSFDFAKQLVQENNIKSARQYWDFRRANNLIALPYDPRAFYKNTGWINWYDFLGK